MRNRIPPPVLTVIAAGLMWIFHTQFQNFSILNNGLHVLSYLFWALGAGVLLWAGVLFKVNKTTVNPFKPDNTRTVVDTGPYRISRNPMYLGMLLFLLGCGIMWLSYLAGPILIGFIYYMTAFQIKPEEAALTAQFGDNYRDYRARVRRWI